MRPGPRGFGQFAADETVQALNRDYRDQDKPTNVLSFAQLDDAPMIIPGAPVLLGDVILGFETCEREASEQRKPLPIMSPICSAMAALHLLGFDHVTDEDAAIMENQERRLMARFGLPDPYVAD